MSLEPIGTRFREQVDKILMEEWAGPYMVTQGRMVDATKLPGFVWVEDGVVKGAVTYEIRDGACEVLSLNSFAEGRGIGRRLLLAVRTEAEKAGCSRLWLVTTNDNIHAIRYYQRQGFTLKAVHIGALEESRRLKPEIPLAGMEGIALLHEFEFEWEL